MHVAFRFQRFPRHSKTQSSFSALVSDILVFFCFCMFFYVFVLHGFGFSLKPCFQWSMDRLDLSDLSGRTPAGERRWKLGTFLANSALSRRWTVCEDVLMAVAKKTAHGYKRHRKSMEYPGNLWKSMEIWSSISDFGLQGRQCDDRKDPSRLPQRHLLAAEHPECKAHPHECQEKDWDAWTEI